MAKPFKGVIKLDIRDSKPDWEPFILGMDSGDAVSRDYKAPGTFKGGRIPGVPVTVKKSQYLDLQKLAHAAFAVD